MSARWQRIWAMIQRGLRFIHHELWEVEISKLPRSRRFAVQLLRTGHLVFRGIKEDNLPLHASALTLGTLISMVPIMAITFSMWKGLGAGDQDVEAMLTEWMEDMPMEFQDFVMQMLDQYAQVNVAAMGGIFLVVVLFIVIKMLGSIEDAFNRIWYISTSRNILRKVSNYISILVIVPILIVASSAATALVDAYLREQWESVAFVYRSLLRLGPVFGAWLAFSFLYMFVPNTRVKVAPGLISGLIGAMIWLSWQTIYINFQVGVSKYNAIYGTFASVPIFLGWLYVSWIIVLLGAEIAFALQNSTTYQLERAASGASAKSKLMLAIGIIKRAAQAQEPGASVFESDAYAQEKQVSIRLVNEMVRVLERAGLMGALADQPGCYALLKAPDRIQLKDIVDLVLLDGSTPEELGLDHLDVAVRHVLDGLETDMARGLQERTVGDLTRSEPGTKG
jgi:membrane protein